MRNILRLSVLSMAVALIASCTNPQNSSTKSEAKSLVAGSTLPLRSAEPITIDASQLNNYTYSIVLDTVINGSDTLIAFALQVTDISKVNVAPDGSGTFDRTVNNMITDPNNVLIKAEDAQTVSINSNLDDQIPLGNGSNKCIKLSLNQDISTRNGYIIGKDGDSIAINKIGWISHRNGGLDLSIGFIDDDLKTSTSRYK